MIHRLIVSLLLLPIATGVFAQTGKPSPDQEIANLQQLIDAKGFHWTAGHTTTSDLSAEERQRLLGYKPPQGYDEWLARQPKFSADPKMALPVAFDWRDSGIMTPVKNQAGCGSCWDFGAIGAFEAAIKHHDGIEYDLSEQQALSCNVYGSSCAGGWVEPVYELFRRYGAVLETCMPYQANDAVPCTQDLCQPAVKLKDWLYVANNVNSIKQAILINPVATSFTVYDDFFNYSTGCYQHTWGDVAGGHIVVIVGWVDDFCGPDEGAWICKNSWSPGWGGLGGYFYIKWGDSNIGSNVVLPVYPPDPVTLSYESHQIDDSGGDNDHIPEAGESISLPITLRNSGLTTATNVQAVLRTPTAGIHIIDSTASFSDVPFDQVKSTIAPHFTVELDSTVTAGSRFDLTLQISCTQGNFARSFYDYAGRLDTVFADGAELGPGSWFHGGTLDDWQCDKPNGLGKSDPKTAHSGSNIWGNNLSGDYAANASNYLESRAIDCRYISKAKLRYYRCLATEKGIYDQARILINGSKVWENDQEYDQIDSRWTYHDIDISSYADGNDAVKVRFEMQTDVGLQLGGWSIDDIAVAGVLSYLPGDANGDSGVDVADAVYLIAYIFSGGPTPSPQPAGDSNGDDMIDVSDVVYLIGYIFGGGAAPRCK